MDNFNPLRALPQSNQQSLYEIQQNFNTILRLHEEVCPRSCNNCRLLRRLIDCILDIIRLDINCIATNTIEFCVRNLPPHNPDDQQDPEAKRLKKN